MVLVAILGGPETARADCAADLAAMQAKLSQVKDSKRQEEARLLIEKASIDQQHGRAALCEAALARAGNLMK